MSIELYRIKYLIYAFSIDIKNFNEARAFTQQKNACSLCVCVCVVAMQSTVVLRNMWKAMERKRESAIHCIESANVLKELPCFVAELERESATAAALLEVKSNQNIAN